MVSAMGGGTEPCLGQTGPESLCLCICSSDGQKLIKNKTQRSSRGTGQAPSRLLPELSRLPQAPWLCQGSPGSPAEQCDYRGQSSSGQAALCLLNYSNNNLEEIRAGPGNTDYVLSCSCSSISLQGVSIPSRIHLECGSQQLYPLPVTPLCRSHGTSASNAGLDAPFCSVYITPVQQPAALALAWLSSGMHAQHTDKLR